MKYLKTYKLFEAYVDTPLFTRFSHIDLLNGEDEVEFTPSERRMIGPQLFNDILVNIGFPDKGKCVHFTGFRYHLDNRKRIVKELIEESKSAYDYIVKEFGFHSNYMV